MYWTVLTCVLLAGAADRPCAEWASEPPEALVRAEAARMSLRKAWIEWSAENFYMSDWARDNLDNPEVVVFRTWDMATFHVFQAAGEDRLDKNLGDSAGVRVYKLDGTPANARGVWGDRPVGILVDEGCCWQAWEAAPDEGRPLPAHVYPDSAPVRKLDLRMLGVSPAMPGGGRRRPRILSAVDKGTQYCEREEGAFRVVHVRRPNSEAVYWIDPSKDYAVVRSQLLWGGKLRFEARSRLKLMGDVWFPEVVELFRWDHEGGATPAAIVRVHEARFNTPDLPDDLTPRDIGIEPGRTVTVFSSDLREVATASWDGQALRVFTPLSSEEMAKLPPMVKVEAPAAPEAAGTHAKGSGPATLVVMLSEWERYTLDFIDRHRFDRRRAQQAWLLLRRCQVQAQNILVAKARTLETVERLEQQIEAAPPGRRKRLQERRDALARSVHQPIDSIFEQGLKAGLRQLLDPEQRRRAEREEQTAGRP